jgi:hypothetical protein
VIAGVTLSRFNFWLSPGTIKSAQAIEHLKTQSATLGRPLLTIWDGLQEHRSKLLRA